MCGGIAIKLCDYIEQNGSPSFDWVSFWGLKGRQEAKKGLLGGRVALQSLSTLKKGATTFYFQLNEASPKFP